MAKSAHAFRTISEAADEIGVAQHVLRFWETKFAFIRPMKRAGGRRFYRPADIAVLAAVRRLLHHEGYTIKNVQQVHRDHGLKGLTLTAGAASPTIKSFRVPSAGSRGPGFPTAAHPEGLVRALGALKSAKVRLDALLDDR